MLTLTVVTATLSFNVLPLTLATAMLNVNVLPLKRQSRQRSGKGAISVKIVTPTEVGKNQTNNSLVKHVEHYFRLPLSALT